MLTPINDPHSQQNPPLNINMVNHDDGLSTLKAVIDLFESSKIVKKPFSKKNADYKYNKISSGIDSPDETERNKSIVKINKYVKKLSDLDLKKYSPQINKLNKLLDNSQKRQAAILITKRLANLRSQSELLESIQTLSRDDFKSSQKLLEELISVLDLKTEVNKLKSEIKEFNETSQDTPDFLVIVNKTDERLDTLLEKKEERISEIKQLLTTKNHANIDRDFFIKNMQKLDTVIDNTEKIFNEIDKKT